MKPGPVDCLGVAQDLIEGARRRGRRAPSVDSEKHHTHLHLYPLGKCRWRGVRPFMVLLYLIVGVRTSPVFGLQEPSAVDSFAKPRLRLTQTVLIRGTLTGDPELTAPRALLADSGNIYVLDPVVHGVHRFDSLGNWLSTIGTDGDGPGEFRRPTDMGWSADTLWVSDLALGRLTLFDPDSASTIREVQFRVGSLRSVTVPRRMIGASILGVPQFPSDASADVDSIPFLLLDEAGNVRDTLAWQAVGRGTISVSIDMGAGGDRSDYGTLTLNHPFDMRSLTAADPRGRWVYVGTWRTDFGGQSFLEVVKMSGTADTLGVVRLPFRRDVASQQDIDAYVRGAHRGLPEVVRARLTVRELGEELRSQVADPTQPTVDAMMTGDDQRIWFRKTMRTGDRQRQRQWMAYHFEEGYVGNVRLPTGHDLLAASGGLLWTVSRDGLGLPTIAGWTVSWPGPIGR